MRVDLRRVCRRRLLASAAWAAIGLLLAGTPRPARAAGVVGTGTPDSCTDAALNAALAGGGLVTFDCGPDPVSIDISTGTGTKIIETPTTIDGGGHITISGGHTVRVFSVNNGINFTVENLTIADGYDAADGDVPDPVELKH